MCFTNTPTTTNEGFARCQRRPSLCLYQGGCPGASINLSKVTVPRSLIGRVGAAAAMEKLRFPPTTATATQTACSRDRCETPFPSEQAKRSTRRDAARQTKKRVSAYLSIKVGGACYVVVACRTVIPFPGWSTTVHANREEESRPSFGVILVVVMVVR